MNGSNSFNTCPRCHNANALSAKYCSRCGQQLSVPREAVVCHRCHSENPPLANFCRSCGATLKVGLQTKICPSCGREIGVEENTCSCGYVFATVLEVTPVQPAEENSATDTAEKPSDRVHGRAFAIVATVLLAIISYLVLAPAAIRPFFLVAFDGGVLNSSDFAPAGYSQEIYGIEVVSMFVSAAKLGEGFDAILAAIGGLGSFVAFCLCSAFIVSAVVHLAVCIIRICTQKRSKHPNYVFLIVACFSTVAAGLLAMGQYVPSGDSFFAIVAEAFASKYDIGLVTYLIPVYFWIFFVYSAIAAVKTKDDDNEEPATEAETTK